MAKSHRQTIARALAAGAGIGYAQALHLVTQASNAGLLPSRLDETGIRAAVRMLLSTPAVPARSTTFGPLPLDSDAVAAARRVVEGRHFAGTGTLGPGLYLMLGTVRSGRTTTAYDLARRAVAAGQSVVAVESVAEQPLDGATRVPVDRGEPVGYAASQALRMRPDVLFIDELRDPETARTALEVAQSGHTVVTTLHASSHPAAESSWHHRLRLLVQPASHTLPMPDTTVVRHERVPYVCRRHSTAETIDVEDGRAVFTEAWATDGPLEVLACDGVCAGSNSRYNRTSSPAPKACANCAANRGEGTLIARTWNAAAARDLSSEPEDTWRSQHQAEVAAALFTLVASHNIDMNSAASLLGHH